MSSMKKCEKACHRNRPFRPKCWINSSICATLVRLQRPLPVRRSLSPGRFIFSSSSVSAPDAAAIPAAIKPAGPPPMTMTSYLLMISNGSVGNPQPGSNGLIFTS